MKYLIKENKIKCPKDLSFEDTFKDEDCKISQEFGDCVHCWESEIAKFEQDTYNKAIEDFSKILLEKGLGDKQTIKQIAMQLIRNPD